MELESNSFKKSVIAELVDNFTQKKLKEQLHKRHLDLLGQCKVLKIVFIRPSYNKSD